MKEQALCLLILALLSLSVSANQTPEMFRYQGRLVDGTNLVNATLPMSFKLYDAPSGGTLHYEDSSTVLVVDGLYSTMIGDDTVYGSLLDALTNTALYLELTIDGETLLPRERVVSVPYALSADGHTHERIIRLDSDSEDGSDGTIYCGSSYVGFSVNESSSLGIINAGDDVMTFTGIEFSDSSFSGNLNEPERYYLSNNKILPFGARSLEITFTPALAKEYSETITVVCDYTSGTNTIICTGIGVTMPYVDNGTGTITDTTTGLMWLKDANQGKMTWSNAVTYCENLVAGGYSDWRLPSMNYNGDTAELDTLFRAGGNPSGDWLGWNVTPFTNVQNNSYWSSTLIEPDRAYVVDMSWGNVSSNTPMTGNYIRYPWPVRGGE